jgi:hypothetical protein
MCGATASIDTPLLTLTAAVPPAVPVPAAFSLSARTIHLVRRQHAIRLAQTASLIHLRTPQFACAAAASVNASLLTLTAAVPVPPPAAPS